MVSRSPGIAIVFVQNTDRSVFESELMSRKIKARMQLIPIFVEYFRYYPINLLRNIAIAHVKTTHFLLVDLYTWPSGAFSCLLSP